MTVPKERDLPPGSARYTSPVLGQDQIVRLWLRLERLRASSCRLVITEHPGETVVEVVPVEEG